MECDMKMDRSDITQISLQKLNWLFIPTSSVKTSDFPFNQTQLPSIRSYNINLFLTIFEMISSVKIVSDASILTPRGPQLPRSEVFPCWRVGRMCGNQLLVSSVSWWRISTIQMNIVSQPYKRSRFKLWEYKSCLIASRQNRGVNYGPPPFSYLIVQDLPLCTLPQI